MRSLDLKFNPLKCHVLRVGKNYDNACNSVLLDNCAIAFEDSITYLGTLIRAGRTWRTDSSPRRRQCFRSFNSIFCKSAHLSEPALQHLAESFCMPVLLYNLDAAGVSKLECTRIEHAWNMMMYKIYGVSGDMLHLIYAYTYCIPLKSELLVRQCTFLTNCCKVNNSALQFIYECFGRRDLRDCLLNLGIDDLNVCSMSSRTIRNVVLDRFVHSVVSKLLLCFLIVFYYSATGLLVNKVSYLKKGHAQKYW